MAFASLIGAFEVGCQSPDVHLFGDIATTDGCGRYH